MAKLTYHYFPVNKFARVIKVATDTAPIAEHTLVSVNASTGVVTVKTTAPVAGDFVVWRPYPNYSVPGDRYGRIPKTPIATSVGELYGFPVEAGDTFVVEDAGAISGYVAGQIVTI